MVADVAAVPAIGLSIAKLGGYQVVLTDSSSEALSVVRFNADNLEVSSNVSFLHGDLLVPLYPRGYAGRLDAEVSARPTFGRGDGQSP